MSFMGKTIIDFINCHDACEISIIISVDYDANFRASCNNNRLIAVKILRNDFNLICCDNNNMSSIVG